MDYEDTVHIDDDIGLSLAVILITACVCGFLISDDVSGTDIQNATIACEQNGGISQIKSYLTSNSAVCNNGAVFSLPSSNSWGSAR